MSSARGIHQKPILSALMELGFLAEAYWLASLESQLTVLVTSLLPCAPSLWRGGCFQPLLSSGYLSVPFCSVKLRTAVQPIPKLSSSLLETEVYTSFL